MEKNTMDKSLLFITLACVCVWLIVDSAIGNKYLYNFLGVMFPFMDGDTTARAEMTTEEVEEAQQNAPSSSAMGSNKKTTNGTSKDTNDAGINSVPYGASRQR